MKIYEPSFYERQSGGSRRSAEVVVPMVMDLLAPLTSVVDVGCGVGTWLSVFIESGIEDVQGFDGPYVRREDLRIPEDRFTAHDLTKPLPTGRSFDLAVSLEVAEHLHPEHADTFVERLCSLSDRVLFSAAIPGQGGTHHVNEQWPSYWIKRFEAHGFGVSDPIRPLIWDRDDVATWYRQNLILFQRGASSSRVLDLVHPSMLAGAVLTASRPPLRKVPEIAIDAARRAIANRAPGKL